MRDESPGTTRAPGREPRARQRRGPRQHASIGDDPPGYAEWAVVFDAESIVSLGALAIEALRRLTTPQLRSLIWIGLVDEGWTRLYTELAERSEELTP